MTHTESARKPGRSSAHDLRPGVMLIQLKGQDVLIRRQGLVEELTLDPEDRFGRVFLREVALIVGGIR